MIVTWLKFWAEQATNQTERKQRLALIEATFPQQCSSVFRATGRKLTRAGRSRCPIAEATS